jgi:KUP system potassium uptake protein
MKHNQVLHQRNVIATVRFDEVPWVAADKRAEVESIGPGFWRVTLHFGFMETPDVPAALRGCEARGLAVPTFETSYFLSRETLVAGAQGSMARWRERLYAAMSRNAVGAAQYFHLPDNAVVELGTRVQI